MTKQGFYDKWLENFACDISESDIKKYVKEAGNYIWHVFSWEMLSKNQYLSGMEAKKAYDKIDKKGALYIEWFGDEQTKDISWSLKNADDLDGFQEVYVVDRDFKWTYIKTHENMCGPYFLKRK